MPLRGGLIALLIAAPPALILGAALAGEWDFSASLAGEFRAFPHQAAFRGQDDAAVSPSVSVEPELVYEWNGGDDRLTLVSFLLWDADDDIRSHGDLREANWLHQADDWDLVIGIDKVFWGVTESRHLVDIINQNDAVESIDGEDKLGQPMINFNLLSDWGTASVFLLPGFRERLFPADDARLRGRCRSTATTRYTNRRPGTATSILPCAGSTAWETGTLACPTSAAPAASPG
jgi:hypothetical protein